MAGPGRLLSPISDAVLCILAENIVSHPIFDFSFVRLGR
ncbi:hypothetical protein B224_0765 [Aeromonas media WS]|nr:hypothetical protein B224_0765 [Aeromonas media WS]